MGFTKKEMECFDDGDVSDMLVVDIVLRVDVLWKCVCGSVFVETKPNERWMAISFSTRFQKKTKTKP